MVQIYKSSSLTPKQAARCCGPMDELLKPATFKALGDPTRLKLFACLVKCNRPCSVTELAECCAVDFSVVSRHLAVLQRAGLLRAKKQGRVVSYDADGAGFANMLRSLAREIEGCCAPANAKARRGACCAQS